MAGDYNIKDIYQGGYSSLKPSYGDVFTGYRASAGSLGLTTDPRSANVLQEVSSKLATGVKHMEMSAIQPDIFESIPKQHLKELNRLSKLTGVDISVHAPIIEASGMTEKGFTESDRVAAERQMFSAVEKSHEINPQGNIPVTFHSSAMLPGQISEKGKEAEEAMVIDTTTGKHGSIPLKERFFPGEEGEKNIKTELEKFNKEKWAEELEQLKYHAAMGKEAIDTSLGTKILSDAEERAGKELTTDENRVRNEFNRGALFLDSSYNNLQQLFEVAHSQSSGAEKSRILNFFKEVEEKAKKIKTIEKENKNSTEGVVLRKEIIDQGIDLLKDINPPKRYKPLNDFAKEKTVQTFANVA